MYCIHFKEGMRKNWGFLISFKQISIALNMHVIYMYVYFKTKISSIIKSLFNPNLFFSRSGICKRFIVGLPHFSSSTFPIDLDVMLITFTNEIMNYCSVYAYKY